MAKKKKGAVVQYTVAHAHPTKDTSHNINVFNPMKDNKNGHMDTCD